jgi:perosamine synthetase
MPTDVLEIAQAEIGEEERRAVERVLSSGRLTQGPEVEAFETELAADCAGTRFAVALASGTAALELVISALEIGEGDEVITTPLTFAATANAIVKARATVRFVDVGDDLNLDPAAARAAITDRTRLLLPVHLYGLPADVDALLLADVPVVEDAAQAHLAALNGRRVGGLGLAGCFSFYGSKNMTTGEGGAVTTNNERLAEKIRMLRNQGMTGAYRYEAIGSNARMTDIAAAIGRVQLRRLPDWTSRRRTTARLYLEALEGIEGIVLPVVPAGSEPAWHVFTIRLLRGISRERVSADLGAAGIQARIYYPEILADVGPYKGHPLVVATGPLDRAREAAATVLSLPVHPRVTEADVERIAHCLIKAVARRRAEAS